MGTRHVRVTRRPYWSARGGGARRGPAPSGAVLPRDGGGSGPTCPGERGPAPPRRPAGRPRRAPILPRVLDPAALPSLPAPSRAPYPRPFPAVPSSSLRPGAGLGAGPYCPPFLRAARRVADPKPAAWSP